MAISFWRLAARLEEIGNVGRHDEQHSQADCQQQAQGRAQDELRAVGAVGEGHDSVMHFCVGAGEGNGELRVEGRDGGTGLRDGDAGLEAGDIVIAAGVARRERVAEPVADLLEHGNGRPELEGQPRHGALEGGGDDSTMVNEWRFTSSVWPTMEGSPPKCRRQ